MKSKISNPQSKIGLPLALLMLRVLFVYYVDAAFSTDDLIVGTPLLYTRANFHESVLNNRGNYETATAIIQCTPPKKAELM